LGYSRRPDGAFSGGLFVEPNGQIWIAVSVYVLVAIVRKRLGAEASLYQILQIFSVTLFEKVPILWALEAIDSQDDFVGDANQMILFDF
jgi:hypothetical protein